MSFMLVVNVMNADYILVTIRTVSMVKMKARTDVTNTNDLEENRDEKYALFVS